MTEKELIAKLKDLRTIKPGKDWVYLNKSRLLGLDEELSTGRIRFSLFSYYFKPVLAGFSALMIFIAVFAFANGSMPGDILYPIKKAMEKSQALFVSEDEKPAFQLKIANQRLEDLAKAPVKNLAPTINEFQTSISEAAKDLGKIDATTSSSVAIRKFIEENKKFEENKEKIEALGVVIDTEEFYKAKYVADREWAEYTINDLEDRSLTEEKQEMLESMKILFEEGKYSEVLELYLINQ